MWSATLRKEAAENRRIVSEVLAYANANKGGYGVAPCIAVTNNIMFELKSPLSTTFWGRWEREPPEVIGAGEVAAMVHRKRDSAASGSQGYVQYTLCRGNQPVLIVYVGSSAPWGSEDPRVGCGFRGLDTVMEDTDRETVSMHTTTAECVTATVCGASVTLKVQLHTTNKSPMIEFSLTQEHRVSVRNRTLNTRIQVHYLKEPPVSLEPGCATDVYVPHRDLSTSISLQSPFAPPSKLDWVCVRDARLLVDDRIAREYSDEHIYSLTSKRTGSRSSWGVTTVHIHEHGGHAGCRCDGQRVAGRLGTLSALKRYPGV